MTATFAAYIDEAGDEGFAFDKGSSQWFIVSAMMARNLDNAALLQAMDHVRAVLNRTTDRDPLHFHKLEHHKRLPYLGTIAELRVRILSVLVHKPSLPDPGAFRGRNGLYFAAVAHLVEKLSWYCREDRNARDAGDGSVQLAFSHRADMSEGEVREQLRRMQGRGDLQVEWRVLRSDLAEVYDPKKRVGLQFADAAASGFHCAVSPRYGYTEPTYAKMLKPVIYAREGRYLGYGLTFWPEGDGLKELLRSGLHLEWVRTHYAEGKGKADPGSQDPTPSGAAALKTT